MSRTSTETLCPVVADILVAPGRSQPTSSSVAGEAEISHCPVHRVSLTCTQKRESYLMTYYYYFQACQWVHILHFLLSICVEGRWLKIFSHSIHSDCFILNLTGSCGKAWYASVWVSEKYWAFPEEAYPF